MNSFTQLEVAVISYLQDYIEQRGLRALIHFELEGCYQLPLGKRIDYKKINQRYV